MAKPKVRNTEVQNSKPVDRQVSLTFSSILRIKRTISHYTVLFRTRANCSRREQPRGGHTGFHTPIRDRTVHGVLAKSQRTVVFGLFFTMVGVDEIAGLSVSSTLGSWDPMRSFVGIVSEAAPETATRWC